MYSRDNITWGEQESTEKEKSREKSKDKSKTDSAGSVSKQGKEKKNSGKSDDGKSEKKKAKKKGSVSERDLTDKSNDTNRSSNIDYTEEKNNASDKKGDKDLEAKKKEDRNEIRPATRRDFYADEDDDDEDDIEKSKDRDKCEWRRPGCEDDCNRFRVRQKENDRCDSCGTRRVECTEKAGACFLQDCCEKKRQDSSVGGECSNKKKDMCGPVCVGKRDSWRGIAEKRCWRCREDRCDRENEERGQRRPERCRDDGYKKDRCKHEREYGKCPLRCDKEWLNEDRCCGRDYNRKRDCGMDREAYDDDDRCRSREAGYSDRQGGRRQNMDETGEGREGRDRSNRKDSSPNRKDDKQSNDPKNNDRNSTKTEKSKDEFSQLKKELLCLQGDMEKMRLCLKTAVILAEKNKCTMTKVKEYIRCNLPDFCKIREKLKQCQLLRLKLSGECSAPSPRMRKEFEYLLCELKALKCELDKLKLERR